MEANMEREFYEREITVRLFQASNALQTYLDRILKEHNLTSKQFFMMIILGSFEHNPKMIDVAERFGTSHQNVKQVLLKLQKQDFIELYKDDKDSRMTRVQFTEKANKFWDERDSQDEKTMNQLYSPLSINDLEIFRTSLLTTIEEIERLSYVREQ